MYYKFYACYNSNLRPTSQKTDPGPISGPPEKAHDRICAPSPPLRIGWMDGKGMKRRACARRNVDASRHVSRTQPRRKRTKNFSLTRRKCFGWKDFLNTDSIIFIHPSTIFCACWKRKLGAPHQEMRVADRHDCALAGECLGEKTPPLEGWETERYL